MYIPFFYYHISGNTSKSTHPTNLMYNETMRGQLAMNSGRCSDPYVVNRLILFLKGANYFLVKI